MSLAKTLVYELYPFAWPGGIKQMTIHLERIASLKCVDYVWLAPIYPSPRSDHGYDIKDYCDVDKRFGTMEDLDRFIQRAHELGIKVLMDLVLNHTSTQHPWFSSKPSYYCWRESVEHFSGWHNLFNSGSAWAKDDKHKGMWYCHMFHKDQADLNWFSDDPKWHPNGGINTALVQEFRRIAKFWLEKHGVDGFRLDAVQSINKDFRMENLELSNLLWGKKSCEVINAIFTGEDAPVTRSGEKPFLMAELLDPSYGDILKMYAKRTPVVDFCLNILVKNAADREAERFDQVIKKACSQPNFMLDLESHDSPRFLSVNPQGKRFASTSVAALVYANPQAICLYQGQELGLYNPSAEELPDDKMLELDAQTLMRWQSGESLKKLRVSSRANARIKIPLEEYKTQESSLLTPLNRSKLLLQYWKIMPKNINS